MATTTEITGRIDRSLHAILAEAQDLPSRADKWDSLPEWERASISLEWDHLMADYLTELDEAYRAAGWRRRRSAAIGTCCGSSRPSCRSFTD